MLVVALVLALLMAGCGGRHEFAGTVYDGERAAGEITGLNGPDAEFRLADHRGEFVLLSFGYASCPDVCPLTLAELAAFYRALESEEPALAERVSVAFVSVDPERDLPERLQTYATAFHPSFYGVHIPEPAALEAVKTAYGVYAEKRMLSEDESAMGYLVDHTGGTFVVGPDGNMRLYLSHDTKAADILADMKALLKRG
jgi:protein SCO1